MRSAGPAHEPKSCRSCGRRIEWRKKWERNWEDVVYCSDACRSRKIRAIDTALEEWLLARLDAAARGSGIDPADAAAAFGGSDCPLHEPARNAARRLVARGLAEMVQRGAVVDPSTAKGFVTLRRPR
ncbi:hypothetical protein CVO76_11985 [Arthrobacter agilis]|uniref:DUF2256 domain-containing protein n=1 Tax=Arthrobacter agilis TaxID=37921 RepID=A0A2L0UGC2_9MICC|nr:DUF2256 and DUF3253 domain-containing protein [Arthrobacter agilis]AUZ88276.1 hypothetical protein CVO76_11985 [Arthrobacter agilis]